MDLKLFGNRLQTLRKQAGLSQERLAEALDRLARSGPTDEYRVVDGTLISRWEGARVHKGRQWKPTRAYVLHLIRLFDSRLDVESARTWAAQAGYSLSDTELQELLPGPAAGVVPELAAGGKPEPGPGQASPRHNLPASLTSFVGREGEMAVLSRYLLCSPTRLVTIVGEGGVGKTRLALTFAQSLVAHHTEVAGDKLPFADGVWFVPLAGLEPGSAAGLANQLATVIAKTLSFSFGRADQEPAAQLLHHLRAKALLLILDNFEHVLAGSAFVLEQLQQAPQVRILITSRAPLNCQAERLLKLDGLPVAAQEGRLAADLPSVQLFVERARGQTADFAVTERTLHDVYRLCRLVDGNPLALELAAHWVQHFSVAEIVDMLRQQDHSLLATDQQDVPMRHRRMDAVFETSWQLLLPAGRQVLAQLAVLRGPFSREAALAVADATLQDLVELVNRSLLHVELGPSGHRTYVMHELLRQYALAKLAALDLEQPGVAQTAHRRHSDYYLRFLAERSQALYGSQMKAASAEVQAAVDNIRAAWQWAVSHNHNEALGRAWLGLRTFYHVRSLFQEGEEVFRTAAGRLAAASMLHPDAAGLAAEVAIAQAFFLNLLHRYDEAIAVVRAVLASRQEQPVAAVTAEAQLEWGIALSFQGRHNEALTHLNEAIHLACRLQLTTVEARARRALYRVLLPQGDIHGAAAALEQALHLYRQLGYRLHEGFVLRSLGFATSLKGQHRKALSYYEQAIAIYQAAEDQARVISIWLHLGEVHDALDDLGRAYHYFRAAYAQREEGQDPRHAANTASEFGRLMARLGEYAQARQYCQQALADQRQLGNHAGVVEALGTLAWVHYQLGNPALALTQFEEALAMSRASGARLDEAHALVGVCMAQAALDHTGEARVAGQQALLLQRELGHRRGVLETLGELARLDLAQDCRAGALARVEEILAALDPSALNGARDPLWVYLTCYEVLRANDDPRAGQLLDESFRRLQQQAAAIDQEELRQSFLSNVPVNRTLAALVGSPYLVCPKSHSL